MSKLVIEAYQVNDYVNPKMPETKKRICAFCGKAVNVDVDYIQEHLVYDGKFHCGECNLPSDSEYYD